MEGRLILILEDNTEKLQSIILDYPAENIAIQRTVTSALNLMRLLAADKFDLVLDNELAPGCGTGLEFLEEAIKTNPHWKIASVRCISYSKDACRKMYKLTVEHGIPWKDGRS